MCIIKHVAEVSRKANLRYGPVVQSVTSRIRSLCDFTKTELLPGETKEFCLTISQEALTQWDGAMKPVVLPGKIQWFLGDCGKELLTGEFTL